MVDIHTTSYTHTYRVIASEAEGNHHGCKTDSWCYICIKHAEGYQLKILVHEDLTKLFPLS